MQVCRKCNKDLELIEFHKDKRNPSGLSYRCKECARAKSIQWNRENKKRKAINGKIYYESVYKEIQATRHKERYESDPEFKADVKRRALKWGRAHPEYMLEKTRRRQARKLAVTVEKVDYMKILERDGYWCYLCEQEIDPDIKPKTPQSISYDHIIPLAKGGPHSYENIKVAHFGCNSSKGAR